MDGFVHLHVHSHYSLLDGSNRIGDLIGTAGSFGMGAMALTDHGNLFGAVAFYKAAVAAGVKPILGIEAFISPTTRRDRSMGNISTAAYHLILLAMNEAGWRNLLKLSSRSYTEGFYYRPRIDRELLGEFNEGLICTTACLGGEVPAALLAKQQKQAERIAGEYRDIFGKERFFIEIQNQGLADQDQVNPQLVALAGHLGVGLVGTNDVHFLRRQDKSAHEVLTCISTGKTLASGGAMEYSPQLYLKSQEEMRRALSDWPEAADNTLKIAEMCELKLDFTRRHLPKFHTPDGQSPGQYLTELARKGLRERFGADGPPDNYKQSLERELKVIVDKGYSSYFLVVNDFVQFAKRCDIPAAPRGSGVAALLCYALGIAEVDPLRYGLLFERFTDPQREEAPDMDIDICQVGRAKVIQYVREKYGHVAQIITYGTLKPRAAIRDVGRVMEMPLSEVDAIAKKVPAGPFVTFETALESEPDLRNLCESDPRVGKVIAYARTLEGLARHAGMHAAGVVVAQEPLENLVPLCKQADSDDPITQWDGPTCDEIGLMKIDFLGLRTLTVLQRARELVRRRTGEDIDPESLPLDDDRVFELFRQGHTDGVFQFESEGMKNVLMRMQPTRIEDLIAANAMYRPGPMELIQTYCARKHGAEPIPSVHPAVDDVLAETYGVMCYQEQVMQVLNRLGGLPLNQALTLIKAVSKKKASAIAAERSNFVAGARDNGIGEEEAEALFELIMKFAGYGFNKAHSTRYAIVAYQTAYFKVHHPTEFIAATLTFECDDTDKVVKYMAEAERMGVKIAPPDINTCDSDFAVDGDQARFGLAAVKGVGAKAVGAIVAAREQVGVFSDLYHFCQNVDSRSVNRSTLEALIKCGAFDALGAHRAAMLAAIDQAIEIGQVTAADRKSGQMSFFDAAGEGDNTPAPSFPDVEPLSQTQLLAAEKETLGFYVTSHPLIKYGRELASLSWPAKISLARLGDYNAAAVVRIGCMIASVRPTTTKTGRSAGRKMAMLTLEDLTGKRDAVVFSDAYERFGEQLKPEAMVFLAGTVDTRRERPSIIVDELIPIDQAIEQLTGSVLLRLSGLEGGETLLRQIQDVLRQHRGACPVLIELRPQSRSDVRTTLRLGKQWLVRPCRPLVDRLIELLGEENLLLSPKSHNGGRPPSNGANRRRYSRRAGAPPAGPDPRPSPAVTRFN